MIAAKLIKLLPPYKVYYHIELQLLNYILRLSALFNKQLFVIFAYNYSIILNTGDL